MPLLYKKEPSNMKDVRDITRQDAEAMKKHRYLTEYTTGDMAELVNLVRTYINPKAPSCTTCQGNLRVIKTELNTFYNQYASQFDDFIREREEKEKMSELERAKTEVKEYSKKKKKEE